MGAIIENENVIHKKKVGNGESRRNKNTLKIAFCLGFLKEMIESFHYQKEQQGWKGESLSMTLFRMKKRGSNPIYENIKRYHCNTTHNPSDKIDGNPHGLEEDECKASLPCQMSFRDQSLK